MIVEYLKVTALGINLTLAIINAARLRRKMKKNER